MYNLVAEPGRTSQVKVYEVNKLQHIGKHFNECQRQSALQVDVENDGQICCDDVVIYYEEET